eukprot:CAMPEP_0171458116 /NCGR_PEP_ID=MMETSP0945-20130129/3922_1 /TAXON_ID=109269 /ORGANISM="Vaucheria litorea, Strain CCMP2940" /LENGTH=206 /DNA_ID=CAMNT_0011983857 /DNA_START=105 /DNA_END=722 /DNA_ORIENTATION=+
MSAPPPFDHIFKILLIGDAAVGKSSMMVRFTDDSFDEHITATIGVDFKVKIMEIGEKRVKMTIWDTAGQERFRTLTSSYYRGAQGIMLVYDITRRDTFEGLHKWLEEVEIYHPSQGKDVIKLLIGNKVDCAREVPREEAENWARSKGMIFLETSAKTQVGIQEAFSEVAHKIMENPTLLATSRQASRRQTVALDKDKKGDSQQGCQ